MTKSIKQKELKMLSREEVILISLENCRFNAENQCYSLSSAYTYLTKINFLQQGIFASGTKDKFFLSERVETSFPKGEIPLAMKIDRHGIITSIKTNASIYDYVPKFLTNISSLTISEYPVYEDSNTKETCILSVGNE